MITTGFVMLALQAIFSAGTMLFKTQEPWLRCVDAVLLTASSAGVVGLWPLVFGA